jgi:transcriptional regulator
VNRTKTERNAKIIELANKGWRHIAIARMFKMKTSAVGMVIWRARHRKNEE